MIQVLRLAHGTLSALETRVPPPVLFVALAAAVWLWPQASRTVPFLPAAGVLFVAIGLGLNAWPKLLFRRAGTTVSPLQPDHASALVTSGPYRFSRNPMYLGYALALVGWVCWLGKPAGLAAVAFFVACVTRLQVVPEERLLSARFPGEYAAYRRAVRRWF